MRPRIPILAAASLILLLAGTPVRAEDDPFDRLQPERMLGQVFSDANLSLLFGLLRQNIAAAADGGPTAEPSAEDRQRLEAAANAMRREMLQGMGLLIGGLEIEVRRSLREEFRSP